MKYKIIAILISSLSLFIEFRATGMNPDSTNLAQTALSLYNKNRYNQALLIYESLLIKYPKDFLYNYYAGVCLLKTRQNIPLAVEYLKFASTKLVPEDVYFYLGQAYQLNYEFNNAIADYDQYLSKLPITALSKKEEVLYNKQTAINARKEVQQIKQATMLMNDSIAAANVAPYINNFLISGKFIKKPPELKGEDTNDPFPYLYYPDNSELHNQITFAGCEHDKSKNYDILITAESAVGTWQAPTNAGFVINSAFNENYAFFNYQSNTLYFSSDGPGGMGGYDNYYSKYNPATKTWSTPVNMGFPMNTPYDDFLVVPSETEDEVFYFFSNRATSENNLIVYKIKRTDCIQSNDENTLSANELLHLSLFNAPNTNITPVKVTFQEAALYTATSSSQKEISLTESNEDDYNTLISEALKYQLRADSASRAIVDHQQDLQTTTHDQQTKTVIYQDINRLTSIKKASQQEADRLFALAREYEQQNFNTSYTDYQGNYQNGNNSNTNTTGNGQQDTKNPQITEVNSKEQIVLNEFKIYNRSMYSEKNPIPVDFKPQNGLMYTIQLGAFSKALALDHFKGIYPISGEFIAEKNITKYYAGSFNNYQQAYQALQQIKTAGFSDAYLVAYMDGIKVSINRAVEIEKEINGN
jgi:hypothetical protein